MNRSVSPSVRELVLERDGYTCRYCGSKTPPFHLDHVYPFSKGGETSYQNLVTSCEKCNHSKHNKVGIYPKPIGYFEREKFRKFWLFWSGVTLGILTSIIGLFAITEPNPVYQEIELCLYIICWIPLIVELFHLSWSKTEELWKEINS
jgi:HNH endonuclease